MPDLIVHAADNPEFARIVKTSRLKDLAEFDFDIAPSESEARALARLIGAQRVRKLRFNGQLVPLDGGGWRLEADLGASVVQTCVVTLEPVTSRVDQRVVRKFLPNTGARHAEIVLSPDDDEELEPLGDQIDLGLVAIEALVLALPAYPRKEGAEIGADADADVSALEELKPFAGLAALRGKLGGGS